MRIVLLSLIVFGAIFIAGSVNTSAQQTDRPLKITSKPSPRLNGDCGRSGSGRMRVRVTFAKDGKVSNVEVVETSPCKTFDERAVKSAYRIKFDPAIKNGEAITITRLIEYMFEIY